MQSISIINRMLEGVSPSFSETDYDVLLREAKEAGYSILTFKHIEDFDSQGCMVLKNLRTRNYAIIMDIQRSGDTPLFELYELNDAPTRPNDYRKDHFPLEVDFSH